jgi:hypothetical protein
VENLNTITHNMSRTYKIRVYILSTRNFWLIPYCIWQLLLYLLLKLTQIYSAAAWSWIVQHIFQIILFNFVSGDLYRFCKLDILLKIALKHSTGTQNHVAKSNQIRLEGSLVLMRMEGRQSCQTYICNIKRGPPLNDDLQQGLK